MNNSEDEIEDDDDDFFSLVLTDEESSNQRTAVRYIRTDIIVTFRTLGFFSFSKFHPASLLDISSKGVAIECDKSMSLNTKVILKLLFEDKTEFKIPAKIIQKVKNTKKYGIKFDQYNNEIGDYILSSRNDLLFK